MAVSNSIEYVILFSNLMNAFFIKSIVFLYMFRAIKLHITNIHRQQYIKIPLR